MGYSKDFKYTIKTKEGKVVAQTVVTFGSEDKPFPEDLENNPIALMAVMDHKKVFLEETFTVEVDDKNLEFDI